MPKAVLTDKLIEDLKPPPSGLMIIWDEHEKAPRGFGVRVTKNGAKSFILAYRPTIGPKAGLERRMTLGPADPTTLTAADARRLAGAKWKEAYGGKDPLEEKQATRRAARERREAPDMNELADRYLKEYATKKKRPRSVYEDESLLRQHVRRKLGRLKVADVTRDQVKELKREITEDYGTPQRANGALALLSKMFNLAIEWKLRSDNPAEGVERNPSHHRERYLDPNTELERFLHALDEHSDREGINALRLLLLTGSRRNEVLRATWDQFDLEAGRWVKPSSHTKQKREHRLDLSPQARQLLMQMRADADNGEKRARAFERQADKETVPHRRKALFNQARLARLQRESPFLFPSTKRAGEPLEGLRALWVSVCNDAKLIDFRLHDLRHSFASLLLRKGHSLKLVGHLLGHTQVATTNRYSHVMADMARAAAGDVAR